MYSVTCDKRIKLHLAVIITIVIMVTEITLSIEMIEIGDTDNDKW